MFRSLRTRLSERASDYFLAIVLIWLTTRINTKPQKHWDEVPHTDCLRGCRCTCADGILCADGTRFAPGCAVHDPYSWDRLVRHADSPVIWSR